jgi:osmotically-inducible protein OsmY
MVQLTKHIPPTTLGVAVLCVAAACSTTPRKTTEQQLADKETAERVQDALAADSNIYARHIAVQADSGVVHLSGYVWNPEDLYEAQRVAEGVPGVSHVVDELELERGGLGNSPVSR